jgi:hypothetical protein
MMTLYLNQTVTLKSKSSVNEYNESTYTTSTIRARFEYNRDLNRNSNVNGIGEEITSSSIIFTTTAIKVDDVITFDSRDWQIRKVYNYYGLFGEIIGYEGELI